MAASYPGKKGWTLPDRRWLTTFRFDHSAQQVVLQDYIHSVHDAEERVAVTVIAEVGDFIRFDNPRQVMAHLGLTPSEHSSGTAIRRGGITKAGNALARRVLIEGAWTYRMQARVSRNLHDRLEGLPQIVRDIAWKAQVRLCARYRRLAATGKPKVVVTTASGDGGISLGDCTPDADRFPRLILRR
jgi:transposase